MAVNSKFIPISKWDILFRIFVYLSEKCLYLIVSETGECMFMKYVKKSAGFKIPYVKIIRMKLWAETSSE